MSDQPAIGIIGGTDRLDSNTAKVVQAYRQVAEAEGVAVTWMDLDRLPRDLDRIGPYGEPGPEVLELVSTHVDPFRHLVFVLPEYNGSFPGILKLFMDTVHPRHFQGKRVALVGVSDGRAGNLRGLDQFQAVLNYLKADVIWHKPKLSGIGRLLDLATGELQDEGIRQQFRDQLKLLLAG